MLRLLPKLPFFLLAAVFCTSRPVLAGKSVLVLQSTASSNDDYSTFFNSLSPFGFNFDFKAYKDSSLKLKEYDTWLYDHLLILVPQAEGFGGSIDNPAILEFVDSGRNLLLVASSEVSETIRLLATECGVDIDDKRTVVHDHFSYAAIAGKEDHTLVASSLLVKAAVIVGDPKAPVLFKGVAQTVAPESELTTIVLSAGPTAYSQDPKKPVAEPPQTTVGSGISLVTAVQARNNARVVVAGSLEMFADALVGAAFSVPATGKTYDKPGNTEFLVSLARWCFQDTGMLVAKNLRHHFQSGGDQPTIYRITDDVEFAVDIFESAGGELVPYKADDVQVEFVMLNPYVRLPLKHDGKGTFSLKFKVPDVYGVFKYVIDYKHIGYSYIQLQHQVPVRPFKHDEYERFLVAAYPYYASALSSMLAFLLVGVFFLYHK